jgi:hypothetical protein
METHEEDPVEAHKREFLRKRWERKQQEEQDTIRRAELTHRIMRYLSFPVLIFSIVLFFDKYLPYKTFYETPEVGWQEAYRSSKHRSEYRSFMQTSSFVFEVPNKVHVDYPYYEKGKPAFEISVTRIFRFPIHIRFEVDNLKHSFDIPHLPVTTYFSWNWLLLVSAVFTVVVRKSTPLTYGMAFVPFVFLAVVLLHFW